MRHPFVFSIAFALLTTSNCFAQAAPMTQHRAPEGNVQPAEADAASAPPSTSPAEPLPAPSWRDLLTDPEDGAFDASAFLSSRIGALPILIPITEPAVGYGLGGGLVFFHERPSVLQTPDGPRMVPPTVTAVFGMGTENGSWAAGAGHMHVFDGGRIRYLIGGGYASLNLDWFGEGDRFGGRSFSYNIEAAALIQKLTFKIGDTDFFAGPSQRLLFTNSEFDRPNLPPRFQLDVRPDELDATVSGVGAFVAYDTRDSLFSPTRGTKANLDFTQHFEAIGSDFEYAKLRMEICQYLPLGGPFVLGLRADGQYASDDAPFFDLAMINLRGVQAGRYMDNVALTVEAELRWDITSRWTLVAFGGAGWIADEVDELTESDTYAAGGFGFRYLLARQYDLRMGLDIAHGPEDWGLYVTVGTGWLRD